MPGPDLRQRVREAGTDAPSRRRAGPRGRARRAARSRPRRDVGWRRRCPTLGRTTAPAVVISYARFGRTPRDGRAASIPPVDHERCAVGRSHGERRAVVAVRHVQPAGRDLALLRGHGAASSRIFAPTAFVLGASPTSRTARVPRSASLRITSAGEPSRLTTTSRSPSPSRSPDASACEMSSSVPKRHRALTSSNVMSPRLRTRRSEAGASETPSAGVARARRSAGSAAAPAYRHP